MKRSTRKLKFEKRGRDWAVGVYVQRGKPDRIVIRVKKDSPVMIDMDTVPTSLNDLPPKTPRLPPDPEMLKAIFEKMQMNTEAVNGFAKFTPAEKGGSDG